MTKKRDQGQFEDLEQPGIKRQKSFQTSSSRGSPEKNHHVRVHDQSPKSQDPSKSSTAADNPLAILHSALEQLSTAAETLGDQEIVGQAEALQQSLFKSDTPPVVRALNRRYPEFILSARIPVNPPNSTSASARVLGQAPVLPPIQDADLEKAVFTHSSTFSESVTASVNPAKSTYERLEFLGDAYIEIISTRLIHSRFPTLPTGRQAQLREKLVKNESLAEHANAYRFGQRVNIPHDSAKATTWTKVLADVFEAYVAAIILSDPQDGFVTAERWLEALWAPSLLEVDKVPTVNVDAKNELSRMVVSQGVTIEYIQEGETKLNRKSGKYTFKVGCYLTGWGHKKALLGIGEADNKKRAGMLAASNAMTQSKELLRDARSQKLEYDQKKRQGKDAQKETAAA
jgi:ribonuclease III